MCMPIWFTLDYLVIWLITINIVTASIWLISEFKLIIKG